MYKKQLVIYIIGGLSLFVFSVGASYLVSSLMTRKVINNTTVVKPGSPVAKKSARPTVDPSLPKTEACPLNGALFTKGEKDAWETRRPLGVMIENSLDARPQSGLTTADIVYEAVVEGGITRFMAMFYCDAATAGNLMLAPVRSARIHFVNLISEYDGLYNHVGGAGNCDDPNVDERAKALCVIRTTNIKDLDQFREDGAGAFKVCHRVANRLGDKEVAYEHTMACFLDELYKAGAKQNWTNVDAKGVSWTKRFVPWSFRDASKKTTSPDTARAISYMFWESNRDFNSNYDVRWDYQPQTNTYRRSNGGTVATDLNNDAPIEVSDVIVQFARETDVADKDRHIVYDVVGKGTAIVYMDGVSLPATWSKLSRTSRTTFKDLTGQEIKFAPGKMWISILPIGNKIVVE
jgi:hypothetical protein